jgi:hypothetical protein
MGGHQRRERLFDLLDLGRRVGGGDRVEGARHLAQELSGALQRDDRVLERGADSSATMASISLRCRANPSMNAGR